MKGENDICKAIRDSLAKQPDIASTKVVVDKNDPNHYHVIIKPKEPELDA